MLVTSRVYKFFKDFFNSPSFDLFSSFYCELLLFGMNVLSLYLSGLKSFNLNLKLRFRRFRREFELDEAFVAYQTGGAV